MTPKIDHPVLRGVKPKSETVGTIAAAQWLRRRKIVFFHVPNEGARGARESAILSTMGVRKGVPDLVIPQPPPGGTMGSVIEMKCEAGGKLSPAQRAWLDAFKALGWRTAVCNGGDAAIEQLEAWGYG